MQNKGRLLQSFARNGYVPYVEELLSMGAGAASKVSTIAQGGGGEGGDAVRAPAGGGDGERGEEIWQRRETVSGA